jgi:protein O-GlcNAc transferase
MPPTTAHITSSAQALAEAQRLKDQGKLAQAESICRSVLTNEPDNARALHLLGATLHLLGGRQEEAIALLQRAVDVDPSNAAFWVTLGGNLAIAGQMPRATECFLKATQVNPDFVDGHYNLGLAYKHLNNHAQAEACFRRAIVLLPAHVDAHANLGLALFNQDRRAEAKTALAQALTLSPVHPLALTYTARLLALEGNRQQAEAMLQALDPNASEASLFLLATTYEFMTNNALTMSALRYLVAKYPKSAEAWAALGVGLIGDFQMSEGIEVSKKAIELDDKCASAWCSLGMAYLHSGLYGEAYAALTRTIELRPVLGPRVMRDLMLPCIMGTKEEVRDSRARFKTNLDALMAESLHTDNPLGEIGFTYFYLAYHGENDVDLQRKISAFYRKTAPSLNYVAPHCVERKQHSGTGRIKLGFYSKFISTHSVSFSFARVLEGISATDQFDLFLISDSASHTEGVAEMYPTLRAQAVQVPRELKTATQAISALELDMLIYLDIGMDPLSFLLAFARFAPVQCVMGGHPVTTGISTIDYYFSSDLIEPEDAQEHYSEQLVRLKHGGFNFPRMSGARSEKSATELGMPSHKRIYLCPMTLQKIHPDFDDAINAILTRDPDAAVVFFESAQSPEWARLLKARFDRTILRELRNRVCFMPWIRDQQDLIRIIELSSVVLDPFHFGIGTTGIHVFTAGTPLVTMPSRFMRGRVGYMYCRLLDTMECFAGSLEEYVDKALSIANDPNTRDHLRQKILANSQRIFENPDAAAELADVLMQLSRITR